LPDGRSCVKNQAKRRFHRRNGAEMDVIKPSGQPGRQSPSCRKVSERPNSVLRLASILFLL
jgi:hypothetical protein